MLLRQHVISSYQQGRFHPPLWCENLQINLKKSGDLLAQSKRIGTFIVQGK